MVRSRRETRLPPPFLKRVWLPELEAEKEQDEEADYPFNLNLFRRGQFELDFTSPVTIIVGDNGSGKSTLLEAIAQVAGFGEGGGAAGHMAVAPSAVSGRDAGSLGDALRAAWLPKVGTGFFFRAETFFSLSRYLDEAAYDVGAAPPDFLSHSHGEGFMRFFDERADHLGLYIFDEPEAALSPSRQFDFLRLLHRLNREGRSQIVMATHSPILMALPDAALLSIDRQGLVPTRLEDTDHYRVYREFILYPHETVEAMIE